LQTISRADASRAKLVAMTDCSKERSSSPSTGAFGRLQINIVGIDNGAGLSADARLLQGVLTAAGAMAGWSTRSPTRGALRLNRLLGRRWPAPRFDVNVFLERCIPAWFPLARRNVLIPNPEWFPPEQAALLPQLDQILCKTLDAQAIFNGLGAPTRWIGFTAQDRFGDDLAARGPLRVLHLAGRSEHKGTSRVLEAWRRHPEWPPLTVVRRPLNSDAVLDLPALPNVRYLTERLSDEEIGDLQRTHAVYLLPSEVEGYGQSLVEGLSAGAVVVTTDAPPMNELVTPQRGVLVAATPGEPCRLARLHHVDVDALEARLIDVFAWPVERRMALGSAARRWFSDNDRRFREELPWALRAAAHSKAPMLGVDARGAP